MQIRESAEMYLETILVLSKKGDVRSIDIAREMNFSRPSVSVTVHNLEDEHYISITEKGNIILEEKGREIAERIYERHRVLTAVLTNIGVPEDVAENDACKMEHVISEETFNCIKKHVEDCHCL
ncbi:metal-dependent transcriptional regulator [Treponema sp. C6A8]|uniref:metal-dependent transcriptional regulator n=1 Tax=Treponema sp. C6A8 TaxID=1410609 RepID=UPI000489B583|nr:metal-dependent transcriptional regulator [Treponema sp. C6A8]